MPPRRLLGSWPFRRGKATAAPPAPAIARVAHLAPGNQWYAPAVGGPSSFRQDVFGGAAVRRALAVLERLSPDEYQEYVLGYYRAGLAAFGDEWAYADINTVLLGLAGRLQVGSYLEIGVRRGRSMAMVASQAPGCRMVGCDLWVPGYGGMENPGPELVRDELSRIGFGGTLELVTGDSRQTVPDYLRRHPDAFFDLVTVDGDHTTAGARADLTNVMPRIRIGGAVVFDDLANPAHPGLDAVWEELVGGDRRYSPWAFNELGFGIAFAVRML